MEEEVYKPNYNVIGNVYIAGIFFESGNSETDATIFGYYKSSFDNTLIDITYACDFRIIIDLLTFLDDERSILILEKINERIQESDQWNPGYVDIEGIFGEALLLENQFFKVYKPQQQSGWTGLWYEIKDEIYIIESIQWLPDISSSTGNYNIELKEYNRILNLSFIFYIHLVKIGISEKNARKRAGLKDELLYRLAYLHYKIQEV